MCMEVADGFIHAINQLQGQLCFTILMPGKHRNLFTPCCQQTVIAYDWKPDLECAVCNIYRLRIYLMLTHVTDMQ